MTRTRLETPAILVEGHQVEVNTEDGPMARIVCFAGIEIGGKRYALTAPTGRWYNDAFRFVEAINKMGTVNLALWTEVEDYNREEMEAYNLREECDAGDWSFGVPGTACYR